MQVVKRNGRTEAVSFDKITARIKKLCYGLDENYIDHINISQKVVQGLYDGVTTTELDNLAAETAASMSTVHPDYASLAARIAISNLHKETNKSFSATMRALHQYIDPKTGEAAGLIGDDTMKVIKKNRSQLDAAIIYDRDFDFDYFGYKTLERSYLLRMDGKVVERPQQMLMRVAVGIHGEDIDAAIETYQLMSEKWFIHATPTLFNSGTPKPQMSSCFLLSMTDDSISGIFETLTRCAKISQSAGGIGLSIHNIRATGSYIKGTGGASNGIVPMLKVYNDTARYVDQCFHPDTIVYTQNGVKTINEIVVGDKLLGEQGEYERVGRLLRNDYTGPMIELSVKQSIEPVRVTPEHPFYVLRNQQKMVNFDVIRNRLEKGYAKPEWVEAKELNENDLIVFPAFSKHEEDIYEYNLDDCRFYGMMLGDGHISANGRQAHMTMNGETDDINFVRRYLYENGIHATITDKEDVIKMRFTWSAHLGFKFSREMLYDAEGEKRVHPTMLHLPKEKTLQIVRGLMEADGCVTSRDNFELLLEMTSRNVIESIRFMLMRFGILTCGYERDRIGNVSTYKGITTRKKSWVLRLPKVEALTELFDQPTGKYVSYLTWEGHTFSRVNHIKQVQYSGVVVDFEVLPNHNYVTHVGVAHNGGGKRKGAFAVYIEPWHADIFDFLDLKKNHGKEEMRARDLFYAMWINDLFMERVKNNEKWTLFDPNEAPGLFDVHSGEFEALYHRYEEEGKGRRTIDARELWNAILESQIETGTPYMLYKDAANRKSNQQNLGTIRSSNLCTEILEYTSADEVAVCNLASLALPKYVKDDKTYDFDRLVEVTRVVTRNLNKVIDRNYYPIEEARNSNMRHRPVGLGVQGLADAFIMMRHAFDSEEAKQLNRDIFEAIYFAALTESCALAERDGTYESYPGSPASKGILQFDMWGVTPGKRWDWDGLKAKIAQHGLRNSLLVAPMPTASTSQILGNNECFEPYSSNLYTRRTLSGEFIVVNKHLLHDLIGLGLWDNNMRNRLMAASGSIQDMDDVPEHIRDLYKTVWEISQRVVIDMAADRGAYICQSQSMNLFVQDANFGKLSSMHFYAWQKGLKTGMYYLRSQAARDAIKFTVDQTALKEDAELEATTVVPELAAPAPPPVPAAAKAAAAPKPAADASGFVELTPEEVAKSCSIDDPDCISCQG